MPDRPDDDRLRVLRSTRLLDSNPERAFDRLTRLAAGLLSAPVALVSLVDEHRQFFKSAYGLKDPWATRRETPLTHSFCRHAIGDRAALVVGDARDHPVLRDNLAVRDLNVIAYAGVPLFVADQAIGALCVIDERPRRWTTEEVGLLQDLAESVVSEIELRMALHAATEQRALTDTLLESIGDGVLAVGVARTFLLANETARRIFAETEPGKPIPANWTALHRSRLPDGSALPPEEGALGRGLRGQNTNGLTFTLQRPEAAQPIWVESCGRPVRGPDGQVIAAVAVYRDVTEKKRQADLYSALAGNIPRCAVLLFDKRLRCLATDGQLTREKGFDAEKVFGLRSGAAAETDAPPGPLEDLFCKTLAGESLSTDFLDEGRVLALRTAPVRDALGRLTAGIVLAVDVTAERQAQASLRRSEQIYRAIMQHLPNGAILLVDRNLRYVAADGPIVSDMLRRERVDDLVGRRVAEVTPEGTRDAVVEVFSKALRGERHHVEIRRDDLFFDMNVIPIFEGDEVSHALVSLYDVTPQKTEIERLKAVIAAQTEIASAGLGLKEAMRLIVERARELTAASGAVVELVKGEQMSYGAAVGTLVQDGTRKLEIGSSLSGVCVRTGQTQRCADSETDERVDRETCRRVAARSLLLVPLVHERQTVGVIKVTSPNPSAFDDKHVALLELLASVMAAALDRAAADEALLASEERFRAVAHTANDAIITVDSGGRVAFWNRAAEAIFGRTEEEMRGALLEETMPVRFRAAHRDALARLAAGGERRWVGRTMELVALRRSGEEFPIELSISTWRSRSESFFTAVLRDITARKVAEAKLIERATYDALTGLLTRAAGDERLAAAMALTQRHAVLLSVALLDVDHFKRVNDEHGHGVGDKVLGGLGQLVLKMTRTSDIAVRWGGEEFLLVLPHTGIEGARTLAERIRVGLEAVDHGGIRVTLTAGIAQLQPGEAASDAIARADALLYEGKRAGRNQVRG